LPFSQQPTYSQIIYVCLLFFREQHDVVFEMTNMAINLALWYTKHSAKFAAQDE